MLAGAFVWAASAALCLWSSNVQEGNGRDARKRGEHDAEDKYGSENQQEN
jgi:hypothetical protein